MVYLQVIIVNNNSVELIRTLSIFVIAVVAARFTLFYFILFIRRYFINLCLLQVTHRQQIRRPVV